MSTLKRWKYLLCLFLTWRAGLLVSAFTGCSHGSIRLSSGSSYYGRVEVCIGGEWGTVCRSGWDNNDAAVVCRQLGYSTSGTSTYSPSSGDGAIYMNNVNCRGTELSLFQCDYQSLIGDYYPCSHSYDAGVYCSSSSACTHGQVRLTGSDVSTEGNVEICNSGQWNGVCSYGFDYREAMVVCAQLGLPSTNAQSSNSYRYSRYPILQTYSYSYFNCYGYESSITGCSSSCCYSMCDFTSRAGVTCRGSVAQPNTGSCTGQTVRLVNGSDENEGRVEVCSNGVWGTVYGGYGWDSRGGRVVCRQLGFPNPAVFIYADNTFGAGSGPVLIKYISCIGTEASLFQCSTYNYNYNDRNSAALRCENYPTNQGCQPGSVRLVGGSSPQEGRIEVCAQSSPGVTVWGSVCNAQSYGIAEVVCRQLNYSRSGAVVMSFGPSHNPFVLDGVYCNGGESSLLSCTNSGYHRCHKGQESGVKCQNLCTSGDVHLVDGYTPTEGRLEMCINGSWTSFFGYYSYWDTNAANVACRQMFGSTAFGTSQYYSGSYPYFYGSQYGQGTGSLVISQISCIGNEISLSSCNYTISTGYGHSYDAGIRCYVNTSCAEGQVRLVDGSTANEGRIELCRGGVWVAIYGSGWNYNHAVVVCRQLGYHYEWAIPYGGSYFSKGTTLLEVCSMSCTGSEASIGQCSSYSTIPRITNYNSRSWCGLYLTSTSNSSAGVMCLGPTTNIPECTNGDIQLADGPSSREGRLKICKRDGYWASVCVNGIDKTAALIMCKSLRINATGVRVSSGQYLTYTGPIISSLSCTGRESNWKDCALGSVGSVNCGHEKAAVISCLNDMVSYDVTVTTDPANGPFAIGSTVSLYCQSNPPFPTGVTYTWRSAVPLSAIRADNPQAYNTSITIGLNHPTIGHYYCEVKNGASVIGVGKTDVIVQSLIKSNLNPTLKFSPPQTIVLSVNVTELEVTRYLGSLTWYFEGDPILMGGRVTLSPDRTSLTITNTVESDAGIYEVKHMGLFTSQRQEKCESRVLDALRNYPILSGIRFTVNNTLSGVQQAVSDAHVVPLSIGGPMSIQLSWTHLPGPGYMWYFIQNSYATSVLYYNGQVGVPSGARVSSVRLYGANDAYQNMTIDLVCAQDSGYLDASLMLSTYNYLYWSSGSNELYCPYEYYSFVTQTLGITSIQLDSATFTFTHVDRSSAIAVVGSELPSSVIGGITVGGFLLVLLLVIVVIVVSVIVTKRNKIKATLTSDADPTNQAVRYAVREDRIEEVPCKGDEDYYANLRRSAANFEDSNVYEQT